jgi:hypothetical protein
MVYVNVVHINGIYKSSVDNVGGFSDQTFFVYLLGKTLRYMYF